MLLARSENSSERFYSLSNQVQQEKNVYYETLKTLQHSEGDIKDLMEKGILQQEEEGGRSANYTLKCCRFEKTKISSTFAF
jgi:hypothetical protein